MVRYSANPKLKLKTVATHDGEIEYFKNCRKINEEFFLSTDCILIENNWVYKNNPTILKDYETGKLFLKANRGRRVYGVVEIDEEQNCIYGYFTPCIYKNVKCVDATRNMVTVISEKILKNKKKYVENISDAVWYYTENNSTTSLNSFKRIVNVHDWTAKKYNIEDNAREFDLKKNLHKNYSHDIQDCHKKYGKFLDYSWGVEFEVAAGFIPDHIQARHGIVVCRDGSINGGEYVTIPMEGEKGLASLHALCESAKNRVHLDINCSMHLHLGKFPVENKKLLSALYVLCLKIQNEMFKMLPPYKTYWEGFKRKNYCRHLETMGILINKAKDEGDMVNKVNVIFEKIFNFITDFRLNYSQYRAGQNHPSGQKWDIENRKTWVNFVNTMYSGRKTLEFRAHQATFNPVKTVNWLFICSAILKYAELNADSLLTFERSIDLEEVLTIFAFNDPGNENAEFLSSYLIAYVNSRKLEFEKAAKTKDYECAWDLKEDNFYDFLLEGKNLLM